MWRAAEILLLHRASGALLCYVMNISADNDHKAKKQLHNTKRSCNKPTKKIICSWFYLRSHFTIALCSAIALCSLCAEFTVTQHKPWLPLPFDLEEHPRYFLKTLIFDHLIQYSQYTPPVINKDHTPKTNMNSTEYVQTGEKGPLRSFYDGLRRQENNNEYAGRTSDTEPSNSRKTTRPRYILNQFLLSSEAEKGSAPKIDQNPVSTSHPPNCSSRDSSGASPYESLRGSYPGVDDFLDTINWPTLSPATNLLQTPELLNSMVQRWIIDSSDSALPPPDFKHACPIAYYYIHDIMTGDGINDSVTTAQLLQEMEIVGELLEEAADLTEWDLHALSAVSMALEGLSRGKWVGDSRRGF